MSGDRQPVVGRAWAEVAWHLAVWLGLSFLVLLPASAHPTTMLLGDPEIDVWNHAWGFWYVAESLADGRLPLHTELAGAPEGGGLYFIDTPSAVVWAPVTLLAGPALAYNLSLLVKVALAALSGQLLARALGASRSASWLAGLAMLSLPFLLCELSNGITEVCGLHWGTLSLWALARFLQTRSLRHALALGLFLGLTAVASFYFGLAMGLLVAAGLLVDLGHQLWRGARAEAAHTLGLGAVAAGLSAALALPVWLAFRGTLEHPRALIERPDTMNLGMMAHNAVDPRTYLMPGDFQSVDLLGIYGEPFLHTGYLRWSLLVLAALAVVRRPRACLPWAALAALSAVLGLGARLWWGGEWVMVGEHGLSLPFGWLLAVLPEVAITHPLRLSLGAQVLVAALAAVGLGELLERPGLSARAGLLATVGVGALVVGEGLFASAAPWPLPAADATVPAFYEDLADLDGMVLDLPAEGGANMRTSQYFWFQTVHGRPIPYVPDVRPGGMRDEVGRDALMKWDYHRGSEQPKAPRGAGVDHLRRTYAAIVVHPQLEALAGLERPYSVLLRRSLGAPTHDTPEQRVWLLAGEPAAAGP